MSYNVWPSHYHLFVQHVQTVSTYSFWSSSLDRTGLWKCEYKAELAGKTRQSKWWWILTTSQFLLCLWNRQRHRDGQYHWLINQLKMSTTGTLDIDGFLSNGALTLLVGWQEGYPACKKLVLAYYYYYYKMYWLEWCCHSITVAGALNNEKKRKKCLRSQSWMSNDNENSFVCWWWWFDSSFARLMAPVVATTSIILGFNKNRLTQLHLENGH